MSVKIDEWHDWLRLVLMALSLWCIFVFYSRYRKNGENWNVKTKDHWYSIMMWTISGFVYFGQGILLDRPFTVSFVFMTAALLTSAKALRRRGAWGGTS